MKNYIPVSIFFISGLILTACGANGTSSTPGPVAGSTPAAMQISSPAFATGAAIPAKYTCQGDDSSPALEWSAPPAGTQSLALILDDPDAPGGTWVHWVVYNLPPDSRGLAEGASKGKATSFNLPLGVVQGKTSFGRTDYGGPCPPSGQHRYFFHLYALDTAVRSANLDKAGLLKAMQGHVLAQGELMGVYSKK
jgi:Raf kinase inhibitor-like YbhB/YbcL family protein